MEKVVIYAAYPLWRKNSLVGFARAKELQDEGNDVTVAYCAAKCGTCICNQMGNPVVCGICRTTTRLTAKRLGLNAVPLEIDSESTSNCLDISFSERKELVEGVLSGLISVFRILPKDIKRHRLLRILKRRSYRTAVGLLRQLKSLMARTRPDRFEVFNGRHACSKAGLLAAKSFIIPYYTLEVTSRRRPIIHRGYTAHDRVGVQQRILSQPVDMELATQFYENRKRPQNNRFAKHHSSRFVLPSTDGFDRLVTVFLSSQDEFASLGKSWRSTFDEDHAVIGRLCRRFPKSLFCIRFHPNQGGIKSDITSEFQKLGELPNVTVYYPHDPANTYDLINGSDVVVVFNSTVAAEACWAGKPVIMIGPSFYDRLDVGYTPTDEDELQQLLDIPNLAVKDRQNAARLAHYLLKDGDQMKYIRVDNAEMTADGAPRSLPVLTVMARHFNTLTSEAVKPFV
ncbi:MAG: hypothetical protein R3C05_02690 [Pirellulaceae bacterium]